MKQNIVFLLLINILFSTNLFSNALLINKNSHNIKILPYSKIYLDETMKLKFNEIRNKEFKENKKNILAYGLSPEFTFWSTFKIKNNSNKKIKKIIDFDNPMAFVVNLYEEDGKKYSNGMQNIPKDRTTINPSFEISFEAFETKTFYLESSTFVNSLIINLNLVDVKKYHMEDLKYQIALSLFFGAMLILGLYNLFLFFFIKDTSYLYYVLYIFGISFHQLMYFGYGQLHFLSKEFSVYAVYWGVLQICFPLFFSILFTRKLLNIENYPILNKIFNLFLLLLIIISILCYKNSVLNASYVTYILLPLLFILIFAGFKALIDKHPLASFYLIGWFAVLSSWFFMTLATIGIFNIFEYIPYYIELALVFEGIIFSIALAKRINILKEKNQELDKKLFLQQKNEKEKLKVEVENKTKDLKIALDQKEFLLNEKELLMTELHHRVKNNMQMISSLINLQAKRTPDKQIKDFFMTAINRISAIANLHELLYKQNKIYNIKAKEYFISLIEGLKNISEDKNVSITYDIKTNLNSNDAVYCGLIINELISNSLKYAFESKGNINISLEKNDELYTLKVEDDGKGYNEGERSDSLGLLLINTLVENQLEGSILINTNNGVKNIIQWKV